MADSNGNANPTETTSLLCKDAPRPVDPQLCESNGNLAGSRVFADPAKNVDEEVGEVEEPENPLFTGQPEAAQRMHLLFPAVAIGVGFTGLWGWLAYD